MIFDFDGVVVDSEPVHMAAFQRVLAGEGIELTRGDYYGKYLGFDDHDCFAAVGGDTGRHFSEAQIAEMTRVKTVIVQQAFAESIQPLPGAVALIRSAHRAGIPVAICSGALRAEIKLAAETVGALPHVIIIVAAEDVPRGKPDPACYNLTLERMTEAIGRPIAAGRSLAIEDSPVGIAAANAAGMKTLAVTNSYPPADLAAGNSVVESLEGIDLDSLEELL